MESLEDAQVSAASLCGLPAEEAYELLGTSRKGLSEEEAAARLAEFGENVLTAKKPKPMWMRFGAHLVNMFAILLWVASVLSFLSDQMALGFAIIAVILLNAVFAFVQEFRAEKAIEALRNMLPPKAKVIRGGQMQEIEARTLVPGDVMVVEEGDLISADARLVYSADLRVDNSALTGEVDPVVRRADVVCVDPPSITDVESFIFTGSTAVLGAGRAVVYATGMRTEFGKIAGLTQSVVERLSPLQKNIARLSQLISLIAVVLGVFFFAISKVFVGMQTLEAVVFAIGIIVANVPGRPAAHAHDGALGRRAAHGEAQRAGQEALERRDARLDHGHLHRQDRHAHGEPDDGARNLAARSFRRRRGRRVRTRRVVRDRRQTPRRRCEDAPRRLPRGCGAMQQRAAARSGRGHGRLDDPRRSRPKPRCSCRRRRPGSTSRISKKSVLAASSSRSTRRASA